MEYLATLVRAAHGPLHARNLAREYLQARILACLQHAGAMIPLAFHGGTALRFLYAIPRYSEDLDFALEGDRTRYDFHACLHAIRRELTAEGYAMEIKANDRKIVHSAFIRFRGLLYHLDLSPHLDETLSVKIEVDTNPPSGATLTTTVVRRHVLLHLQHHDRASLLAGKLHSVLQRPYLKGRDLYDLLWYLTAPDWPPPNLLLLNNALGQTGWSGEVLTEQNWHAATRHAVAACDWHRARSDVRPFLENVADADLLQSDHLLRLLGQSGSA
jgi:hypothetical protein